MEEQFYLRDTRSNLGSTCLFYGKNGNGYTSNLNDAEVFSHAEAQRYADKQEHFIPLSKSKVDALTISRIDMQYLEPSDDMSCGAVLQLRPTEYDGNDIFFCDEKGQVTVNYDEAKVFHQSDDIVQFMIGRNGVIHSKRFLDSIVRRSLQVKNVNHRKMITAAGIKYRKPRESKATGKVRSNCPKCGRLVWGYNPHEAEYCREHRFLIID
jgi:hypothetical protein